MEYYISLASAVHLLYFKNDKKYEYFLLLNNFLHYSVDQLNIMTFNKHKQYIHNVVCHTSLVSMTWQLMREYPFPNHRSTEIVLHFNPFDTLTAARGQ